MLENSRTLQLEPEQSDLRQIQETDVKCQLNYTRDQNLHWK